MEPKHAIIDVVAAECKKRSGRGLTLASLEKGSQVINRKGGVLREARILREAGWPFSEPYLETYSYADLET